MLFFIKRIGFFIVDNWKPFAIGLAILLIVIFVYRTCQPAPPKLDQDAIIKAQQAIEKNDRKAMVEVLAASDVKEAGADNSIILIEQATEEAKKNYNGLSNEEIAAELNRRASQ